MYVLNCKIVCIRCLKRLETNDVTINISYLENEYFLNLIQNDTCLNEMITDPYQKELNLVFLWQVVNKIRNNRI